MKGLGGRIELIQVPQPRPAADAFEDEHYTGYYHLSFDLTETIADLPNWVAALEQKFEAAEMSPLKVLLPPQQQQIGQNIYEVAFLADADGLPLEFIRQVTFSESR
jgi:hypothetical protein